MIATRTRKRRGSRPKPTPERAEPVEDAEMRAAWTAYCRRVGKDPRVPPLSDAEWCAAFGTAPEQSWSDAQT
jgi:hypothetical protein